MSKAELVAALVVKTGLKKKEAELVVPAFLEVIVEALKENDTIRLAGFGTFSTKTRAARNGRNPSTGAKLTIPSKIIPHLKFSKDILV